MRNYIKNKSEIDLTLVGAKAGNLVKMAKANINVPNFVCVSSELLDDILSDNNIINDILPTINFKSEDSINQASRQIQDFLKMVQIPKEFELELIKDINKNFKDVEVFSVRSSSLVEDSDNFAFAGQFDTYLNISKSNLLKAILNCFCSLYEANVLKYANINNIDLRDLKMNVIIQEMIVSETSGVIFTSNPQGLLNEAVIINGKGTGNKVVEDKIQVTTYYYNKTDKVYYYEKNLKSPLIDEYVFKDLINVMFKIMKSFGEYLDIEYAILENKIYILQVRPITTLKTDKLVILDNSNIVESYPEITLPLTESFVCGAYTNIFTGVARRCLGNEKVLSKYRPSLNDMVGSANGKMYYKISSWYTIINFLPFSKKIIPIWQEMLGVINKELSFEEINLTFVQKIKIFLNSLWIFLTVTKKMEKINEQFILSSKKFNLKYNETLNNKSLVKLFKDSSDEMLKDWDITLANDMYGFVYTGLLKNCLKKSKVFNAEVLANNYISGITDIESIKPVRELIILANEVSENEILYNQLLVLKDNSDVNKFLNSNNGFSLKVKNYIENFGDRSLEELKLESKTFRSYPMLLIEEILQYSKDKEKLKSLNKKIGKEKETKEIELTSVNLFKKAIIKYLSKRAVRGIRNREISRLNRSRMYGMVRSMFLSMARNFVRENIIDNEEDVFYLKKQEIFDYIEKGTVLDFKALINTRKEEYKIYEELPTYSRLVFAGTVFNKTHKNINSVNVRENKDKIAGIPCSKGVVEGEVLVVSDPKKITDAKDKILVTKMTDPGWVFLLTVAKGVIAEKGSLLSHTAIISRELNIPSIVGVKNITNILKTGDKIMMDGNSGVIQKVND